MIRPKNNALGKAEDAASKIDADVFIFNGSVERFRDLECIEHIFSNIHRKKALLIPVTNGGDPDAAYKITRYFQEKYESFSVLICGLCKSAGTLIAVGANEIIFTPFGELGPLDIQLTKVDRLDQLQSGLAIQEALNTLEDRAKVSFYKIIQEYIQSNSGLISFAAASKAAADFVSNLYAPVFSRIDPEEVGARSRSMRIATEYGKRLGVKSQNLKQDTLRLLAETYSSHSFVIDQHEAEGLFVRVRTASDAERDLVAALGPLARFEVSRTSDFVFCALSKPVNAVKGEDHAAEDHSGGSPSKNGGNPSGTDGKTDPSAARQRRRGPKPDAPDQRVSV